MRKQTRRFNNHLGIWDRRKRNINAKRQHTTIQHPTAIARITNDGAKRGGGERGKDDFEFFHHVGILIWG
jgi:hypothetical protein